MANRGCRVDASSIAGYSFFLMISSLPRMLFSCSLVLALSANLHAQGGPIEEVVASEAATSKKSSPPPAETVERVSDSEKPERSSEYVARMREILTRVLKHLGDAREERDVVKLNCVNEKLTAIKGLLRISEQADVSMQEALARRNNDIAEHEFEKISIAVSKCEQLLAESEACVGELAVYAGDTEVEVEVDGEPPDDLSDSLPSVEVITHPPAASPYQ